MCPRLNQSRLTQDFPCWDESRPRQSGTAALPTLPSAPWEASSETLTLMWELVEGCSSWQGDRNHPWFLLLPYHLPKCQHRMLSKCIFREWSHVADEGGGAFQTKSIYSPICSLLLGPNIKMTFIYAEVIKVTISSFYLNPHIFIPELQNTWIGWSAVIFLWQKSRDWTETSRLTWREMKEDLDLFWCADVDESLILWYTNLGEAGMM